MIIQKLRQTNLNYSGEPHQREVLFADEASDKHFTTDLYDSGLTLREHGWGGQTAVRLTWEELDTIVAIVQAWKQEREAWKESQSLKSQPPADDLPF